MLPDLSSARAEIAAGRRRLAQLLRPRDTPEPVGAWRSAPEAALRSLRLDEKRSYLAAILPVARTARIVERRHLRRLYQLFTFMEIPDELRIELVCALHMNARLSPESLPVFADRSVSRSLLVEVVAMTGKSPSKEARDYIVRLGTHLGLKPDETDRASRFFEKLTDLENRIAAALSKKGHVVRLDDRKLEIFKKAVAAIGVPAAVLFPLGTVGLTADGITSGLIALGGGLVLPAGMAMLTGLGVAVALGVSSKKILDLVMPTTDADRVSLDLEKFNADAAEIRKILEETGGVAPDHKKITAAHTRIGEIVRKLIPLGDRDRRKIEASFERARMLGERYIGYLTRDRAVLAARNHIAADSIASLLQQDLPAIC